MECGETRQSGATTADPESSKQSPHPASSKAESPEPSAVSKKPEEKSKRTKHTRVHKREKELFGLVTPIFLPLLDAGEALPTKKEKKEKKKRIKDKTESGETSPPNSEQGSPPRDVEKVKEERTTRSKSSEKMGKEAASGGASKENQASDLAKKKVKRPAMKKSSLRNSSERSRRKRVSLVIDDQIVLPAEEIPDAPLISPSETTASSASNSTTSLEDAIDPRLMHRHDTPVHEHQDPVHHSLPLPMHLPSASPTKHTGHTLPSSPAHDSPDAHSPRSPLSPRSPSLQYEPPQTDTRTFLDPSPPNANFIPQYASAAPIYASEPEQAEAGEEEFSTYVGGIDGSGVTDLDQTGSLGYPSSLGASFMESYMQSRPLSVRMAAAEKAGLNEKEKRALVVGGGGGNRSRTDAADVGVERIDDIDEEGMGVMGSMEGF